MKRMIIIVIALLLVFMVACKKKKETAAEEIVGIWVGIDQPSVDTLFFYKDGTYKIIGRPGNSSGSRYTINDSTIVFYLTDSSAADTHSYYFYDDKGTCIYISNMLFGFDGDLGLKYRKH